jgi:hypothetical protein
MKLKRPCHLRVIELRDRLDEQMRIGDEMADQVEKLCMRLSRTIDSRQVVISVEEVQDIFARQGKKR